MLGQTKIQIVSYVRSRSVLFSSTSIGLQACCLHDGSGTSLPQSTGPSVRGRGAAIAPSLNRLTPGSSIASSRDADPPPIASSVLFALAGHGPSCSRWGRSACWQGTGSSQSAEAERSIASNDRLSRHPRNHPVDVRPAAGDGGRLRARQPASRPTASRRCGGGHDGEVSDGREHKMRDRTTWPPRSARA